VFKEMP